MTDEELTKEAWKIVNRVLEKIDFPSNVTVSKNEDGTVSFNLTLFSYGSGFAWFYYKPSVETIKKFISDLEETSEKAIGKSLAKEFTDSTAELYAYALLKIFHAEIFETFQSFPDLVSLQLIQVSATAFGRTNKENPEIFNFKEKADKMLNEFFQERNEKTKKLLLEEIESHNESRKPVKHLIDHFYSIYLPFWKEAKACYKKNKNYSNWEQMVALAFPKLPKDLISRLGDSDPYVSMPSALSLEHAARACGIDNDSVGLRALQQYLNDSQKWIAENGEQAKEKELAKYTHRIMEEIVTSCRVAESLGKDSNFDDYPLIYQIIANIIKDDVIRVIRENSENE